MPERKTQDIVVTTDASKNPTKDEEDARELDFAANAVDEADSKDPEEMSEEDRALLEKLELAVSRVVDPGGDEPDGVRQLALETLRTEIRSATASMTSVPKPLKFLRPHYAALTGAHEALMEGSDTQRALADILAVLGMTMAGEGERATLKYKLAGNRAELAPWGDEFVRALAGEVGQEYTARVTEAADGAAADASDLLQLVDIIVPHHVANNAEPEAVDLLLEVAQLGRLLTLEGLELDKPRTDRVCLYLLRSADMMADEEELGQLLETAFELFVRAGNSPDALRVAMRLGSMDKIGAVMDAEADEAVKKQLALMLGSHHVNYECDDDDLMALVSNARLSEYFKALARDLDVLEPKTPEQIYKSHLGETGSTARARDGAAGGAVDSARANLASTFVNAFVNAGFGTDELMTVEGEGGSNQWLFRNRDHGMRSAAASLGVLFLWDADEGLTHLDKWLYSESNHVKAGALLGIGVLSTGTRNDCDPALALLADYLEGDQPQDLKLSAALGLGMAYAGSNREDVAEMLMPLVSSDSMEEASTAALALGLVCVGSCNDDCGTLIVQTFMEASEADLDQSASMFLCLGLGLLFLGQQERADAMVECVKTVAHKRAQFAALTLEACAFAGTGNVLHVQSMLHLCAEQFEDEEAAAHQPVAVLALGLITMGENIGAGMVLRTLEHLLQYGGAPIKRAVPLALAMLHASDPDYTVTDTLSRLTHDQDEATAFNAILGLGLIGCGSNNSRIAGLLRSLASFYAKNPDHLFVVRVAQGLLHMGKGLVTVNPFHSDRTLMSPVAVAALLVVLFAAIDMKHTLLDEKHHLLYALAMAARPRMLLTVGEDLEPLPVTVRVGQAVETVGQAGQPRTITGFQTHTSPVLVGVSERAELGSDEYLALTSVLEGIVVLRENPDSEDAKKDD